MRRVKGRAARKLFEEFPWITVLGSTGLEDCVTAGQVTNEMIQNYLKHHFEPTLNDNFKTES